MDMRHAVVRVQFKLYSLDTTMSKGLHNSSLMPRVHHCAQKPNAIGLRRIIPQPSEQNDITEHDIFDEADCAAEVLLKQKAKQVLTGNAAGGAATAWSDAIFVFAPAPTLGRKREARIRVPRCVRCDSFKSYDVDEAIPPHPAEPSHPDDIGAGDLWGDETWSDVEDNEEEPCGAAHGLRGKIRRLEVSDGPHCAHKADGRQANGSENMLTINVPSCNTAATPQIAQFMATIPMHNSDAFLVDYMCRYSNQTLTAFKVATDYIPLMALRMESCVQAALMALEPWDAVQLRLLSSLEGLRVHSLPVSAAFSFASTTFLSKFLQPGTDGNLCRRATACVPRGALAEMLLGDSVRGDTVDATARLLHCSSHLFGFVLNDHEFAAVCDRVAGHADDDELTRRIVATCCWLRWCRAEPSNSQYRRALAPLAQILFSKASDEASALLLAQKLTHVTQSLFSALVMNATTGCGDSQNRDALFSQQQSRNASLSQHHHNPGFSQSSQKHNRGGSQPLEHFASVHNAIRGISQVDLRGLQLVLRRASQVLCASLHSLFSRAAEASPIGDV